ncbi:MAG TPA: hypothetical protein VIN03_16720 [Roseateles sp.]
MDDKRVIHETPAFTVYVEEFAGCFWVHCDVRKWGVSLAREMVALAPKLFAPFGRVYALHEGCKKHAKFLALMGFQHVQDANSLQGGVVSIYGR